MKVILAVLILTGVVAVVRPQLTPATDPKNAFIRSSDFSSNLPGYRYSFDTSNGIQKEEQGDFSNPGTDQESLVVRGSYSYVDYGGNTISVRYTADESGFHPEGIHITQFARQRSGFPIDAPSPVPQGPYVPYGPQYAQTLK